VCGQKQPKFPEEKICGRFTAWLLQMIARMWPETSGLQMRGFARSVKKERRIKSVNSSGGRQEKV
jgi:hypothetical protein